MLLYDLCAIQPIGSILRHGGGIYGEMVFFKIAEKTNKFACYYDSRKWINPKILDICRNNNIKLYDLKSIQFDDIIDSYTLLYSALPDERAKYVKIRKIFTVHGLRSLEAPNDIMRIRYAIGFKSKIKELIKYYSDNIAKKRDYDNFIRDYCWDSNNIEIVTVSNHSRVSIELLIHDIKRKNIPIRTFYAPNTIDYLKEDAKRNGESYFLMVSGNRYVKNCLRAAIAFDELISEGYLGDVKLKIAGVSEGSYDYKFKNPDKIEFLGYVSDEELKSLYGGAFLFVYPSLNEGFGYPPLEAMFNSVPVISSCFASIPEVCGDAVMYFNPLSIQEIKNRMVQMLDKEVRDHYILKGKERFEYIKSKQDSDLNSMVDYLLEKSK